MAQERDLRKMSALAEQAAEAAAKANVAGLELLLAEMRALCAMMPGMPCCDKAEGGCKAAEERARQVDAEVEESFDNMPL